MADVIITEYAGTRKDPVARFYQYSKGGYGSLIPGKTCKGSISNSSMDMMTERDPSHKDKILRRFVFNTHGMLEETFSFGQRPRTFRYENGGRQIAVREGGQFGAVGKLILFEQNGVVETAWGREGEIERVYIFESAHDAITERKGGWYGVVTRTLVFQRIDTGVFCGPEAFLQFLMFSEQREGERSGEPLEKPSGTDNEGVQPVPRSRFAFSGKSRTTTDTGPVNDEEIRIDFIPDGDVSSGESSKDEIQQKQ